MSHCTALTHFFSVISQSSFLLLLHLEVWDPNCCGHLSHWVWWAAESSSLAAFPSELLLNVPSSSVTIFFFWKSEHHCPTTNFTSLLNLLHVLYVPCLPSWIQAFYFCLLPHSSLPGGGVVPQISCLSLFQLKAHW